MVSSCIIQNCIRMEGKNMAAVESIGTSSEVKEQYENIKSLLGGRFFYFLLPNDNIEKLIYSIKYHL